MQSLLSDDTDGRSAIDLAGALRRRETSAAETLQEDVAALQARRLPYIRFHDLRHTAATLLLPQDMPVKVVSEMLGHANASITMNLYMRVLPTMRQAAAGALEALLQRGLPSKVQSNGQNGGF